jgi:hypothetical protein
LIIDSYNVFLKEEKEIDEIFLQKSSKVIIDNSNFSERSAIKKIYTDKVIIEFLSYVIFGNKEKKLFISGDEVGILIVNITKFRMYLF